MSHFTKLAKANITSADAFAKAAEELGLKVSRDADATSYHGRNKIKNAAVVVHMCQNEDIALTHDEKTGLYDMQSDWGYMGRVMVEAANKIGDNKFRDIEALQDRLIQLTTKHTIVDKYRREGWRAEVTDAQNGDLNVRLARVE